jgi:hypothetical protein
MLGGGAGKFELGGGVAIVPIGCQAQAADDFGDFGLGRARCRAAR